MNSLAALLILTACVGSVSTQKTGCPSTYFTSSSGVMSSPGWPSEYPDRWDCEWNITVPEGQFVHLQFTEFDLENCAKCGCDYVEISDAWSGWSDKYCGSSVPPLVVSQSNTLTIRFYTDGSSSNSGFHAVYTAVRKPYSCKQTGIQALVATGETTVDVEIIPGTSVNLAPGFHTVAIPSVNCFINVTVNSANSPADICPETVSTTANADTELGVFSLSFSGFLYELTLPRGQYDYHYKLQNNDCTTHFKVFDSRLRRRLDFSAEYDIKCSALQFAGSNSALLAVAEQKYPEIERLCRGGCKKSLTESVQTKCENDTTTITWPTDRVFTGSDEEVPSGFIDTSSSSGVRSRTTLSVFLYSKIPRVVYPVMGSDGFTVKSHLISFCTDKYVYDAVNQVCVVV